MLNTLPTDLSTDSVDNPEWPGPENVVLENIAARGAAGSQEPPAAMSFLEQSSMASGVLLGAMTPASL